MRPALLYTLDAAGRPVPENDVQKWATFFQSDKRLVAMDKIGKAKVSTIFLGINLAIFQRVPVLWETMVFGGPLDQTQKRCSGNREQAEAMHAEIVALVRATPAKRRRVKR